MALTKIKADGLTADLIDETKLADNSIDSEHYNDGSIDNAHLADDAVGVAELSATGTASSSTFLRGDNSWVTPTDTNTQLAFANDANNRVVTGDGSGGLNGEANLTFDGSKLLLGTTTEGYSSADDLTIETAGHTGITIRSGTSSEGALMFSDGTSGADEYRGYIQYAHGTNDLRLATDGSERVRIDSSGHALFSGVTSNVDTRNINGITVKSPAGISLTNYGSNGSRNWRIRPDDLNGWADLDFSCAPTDGATDIPDTATDSVLSLQGDTKDVVVSNGNLKIGTSGKGIDFSATAGPTQGSDTSELLDDYEEGTFTAAITVDSGTNPSQNAYSWRYAYYTKIGKVVHFRVDIQFGNISQTGSGNAVISGFPYASSSETQAYGIAYSSGYTRYWGSNNFPTAAYFPVGSTEMYLMKNTVNDGNSYVDASNIVQNTRIICGGTYMTA